MNRKLGLYVCVEFPFQFVAIEYIFCDNINTNADRQKRIFNFFSLFFIFFFYIVVFMEDFVGWINQIIKQIVCSIGHGIKYKSVSWKMSMGVSTMKNVTVCSFIKFHIELYGSDYAGPYVPNDFREPFESCINHILLWDMVKCTYILCYILWWSNKSVLIPHFSWHSKHWFCEMLSVKIKVK